MTVQLIRFRMDSEADVFSARRRTRDVAQALGFDTTDQVRLAVAVSEWGRILVTAGTGAGLNLGLDDRTGFTVAIEADDARAFADPGATAAGVLLSRRLVDRVEVGGRLVTMSKRLPAGRATPAVDALKAAIERQIVPTPLEDLQVQNEELLRTLEELKARQEQLVHLNEELQETNRGVMAMYTQLSTELEETNRGVVALYAELDERGVQLAEANNAKSRFLASVSHELRGPLNSIIALAGLLREPDSEPLTPSQGEQVRLINSSAGEVLGLVNDLLDLAKAESGRLEPAPEPVHLGALLAELRATLRPMTPAGVELAVEAEGVPVVDTDPVLLVHALRNLITNALKFTERGEVSVAARLVDAGTVAITVRDTGIGIDPAHRELVFEEFFQVPGRLQARRKGTGLGLPYAKRVLAVLGGELTLDSAPGGGSVFTATLPVAPVEAAAPVAPAEPAAPVPPAAPAAASTGGLGTILVVDDDPAFRTAVGGMLAGHADRVLEAADPAGALRAAAGARPDLVLLDVRMPGGGGEAVLAGLAARPDLRDIPVLMVTSAAPNDPDYVRVAATRPILEKADLTGSALLAAARATRDGRRR